MSKSLILLQQENLELSKENIALKETVSKLLEELNKVRGIERRSLSTNVEKIVKSLEQIIIEEQIKQLGAISVERALSLEETRALDLLIKNKRLLDPEKSIEPDYTKVPEGKTESDLLELAGSVNVEPAENRESDAAAKGSSEDSLA
jgi:hypothetical protein